MTRQPRSQRKRNPAPIRLNQRDVSLFQALHDYRYLTTQHIQKLFFPSHYTAYDRLRKLYDHAYVDRVMQGVRTEQMNTPLLYVLDRAGFDVLQNNSKRQLTWKRQYKQVGTLFLAHNIAVRDCVVAVHRACRQYDWTLLKWEDEYNLKAQNIQVPLSQSQVVALIPDGYFTVQTDTQAHRFFLELDRGTMHHGRIADKVRIYSRYRDLERHHGQDGNFRVLFVGTSQQRLDNLAATIATLPGEKLFWLAHLDDIKRHNVLTTPLWSVPLRDEKIKLIEDL